MTADEAFIQLFKKLMPKACNTTIGTVESTDKEKRTCDVAREGQPTLFNCRLNSVVDTLDSYVTCFPAVDSYVLCLTLDGFDSVVIAMSAIEMVDVKVGSSTITINDKNIVFNGGALGGLVTIDNLTNKLNALVEKFNSHTHSVATTGSASAQTGTASPVTSTAQQFDKTDYENKNVSQ